MRQLGHGWLQGCVLLMALTHARAFPLPVLDAVKAALQARGTRCSLSEVGVMLQTAGVSLPDGMSLSEFVQQHPSELSLTGPPSHLKVGLVAETTETALVNAVRAVLLGQGAGASMSTSELRLRLREERRFIPSLVTVLRDHSDVFEVDAGTVRLVESTRAAADTAEDDDDGTSPSAPSAPSPRAPPLRRLHGLHLPSSMRSLAPLEWMVECTLIDLDNRAFALEAAVLSAAESEGTLVLAFCSSAHNPRLSLRAAEASASLASEGRLRLLTPLRDAPNAADFVLAFWAGWLHERLPDDAKFSLVTADAHLERTVLDVLLGQGRRVRTCLEDEW